ncbi:hypothetical protein K491DRAFT_72485 [Lophiostoma macrostomum CBS 122681]|uniref:Ankyrin n=1 Tax=Lophiostoma macrostomum CBS 122681 TaxID=1314788 RepID=A0A6A6SW77_9PLEO|nr:hypothetical protein K491DRAFT_72485 [Lophiostoma macrostomum CBS 122681]
MLLLELPPEIFERVIAAYVKESGPTEAWYSRAVCQTFKRFVCHQITVHCPPASEQRRRNIGGPIAVLENSVLRMGMPQYLKYHIQEHGIDQFSLVEFLKEAIRNVQRAEEPNTRVQRIRSEHASDVVDAAVVGLHNAQLAYIDVNPDPWGYDLGYDFNNKTLAINVAAAVGSLAALKRFQAEGMPLDHCSSLLGSPLQAAAFGGKTHIVEHILEYIRRKTQIDVFSRFLQGGIRGAIRGRSAASLDLLLRFCCKSYPETLRQEKIERNIHRWQILAAEVGCVESIRLLKAITNGQPVYSKTYLVAIAHGHATLVRYLYEQEIHILGPKPTWLQDALVTAAKCGSRALANLALDLGADIKEPGALKASIQRCNPWMTKFLLERGAELTYAMVEDVDLSISSSLCCRPLSASEKRRNLAPNRYRRGEQILTYCLVFQELEEWEHLYERKFGRHWPLSLFDPLVQYVQKNDLWKEIIAEHLRPGMELFGKQMLDDGF